jgi:hypothetical protein
MMFVLVSSTGSSSFAPSSIARVPSGQLLIPYADRVRMAMLRFLITRLLSPVFTSSNPLFG